MQNGLSFAAYIAALAVESPLLSLIVISIDQQAFAGT
jgi:hypothetical protein